MFRVVNCAELNWATGCHVCRMVLVFRELYRVLRDDGTCWINYGDSYASGEIGRKDKREGKRFADLATGKGGTANGKEAGISRHTYKPTTGLPSGNLCGVPWRVALALQADGWVLRQDIVWCLSGGTWLYVKTQKGVMPMTIKDIARLDPATVQLWNGQKWTQLLGMSKSRREADELEIVLRSGERISCTPSHKFPSSRGLVEAGDLKVGDCLESCQLPELEPALRPLHIGDDAAWFAGLYLAEGCGVEKGKIQLAGHAKETARWDRVSKIVEDYGGRATLTVSGNVQTIRVYGKLICAIVKELVGGKTAKDKGFAPVVWRYGNQFLQSFMEGYLSGDGHYNSSNDRWRLSFTRNCNLERDLRTACARLGWTLTLNMTYAMFDNRRWPAFRGEIRKTRSGHHNEKSRNEIVEIRNARCRWVYDLGVADSPHVFALASGILTHNSKPSPMPESVRSRCTKAHEYVFLLTKRGSGYYCDMEAIREPLKQNPEDYAKMLASKQRQKSAQLGNSLEAGAGSKTDGFNSFISDGKTGTYIPNGANRRSVWTVDDERALLDWLRENDPALLDEYLTTAVRPDVWRCSSAGYEGSHFATFPVKLIEPMILAGTSAHGACAKCGTPWRRVTATEKLTRERPNEYTKRKPTGKDHITESPDQGYDGHRTRVGLLSYHDKLKIGNTCANTVAGVEVRTLGWEPGCECCGKFETVDGVRLGYGSYHAHEEDGVAYGLRQSGNGPASNPGQPTKEFPAKVRRYVSELPLAEHLVVPCTVLDPFCGSSTTNCVALSHGRRSIGIDLSETYLQNNAIPRIEGEILSRPALAHLVAPAVEREEDEQGGFEL